LSTIDNVTANGDGVDVRPALTRAPASEGEAEAVKVEVLANPLLVDRLVSREGSTAAIYVPLASGADGSAVADGIRGVLAKLALPERVYLAGDPIVNETLAAEVFRQLGVLSPIAGLVMFIALFVMFRNLPMVLAAMFVSLLSTVWAMGLHIALGYTVHLMSAMIPVFLMAIGTDSIHIFNELGFRLRSGSTKREAILTSMAAVGRPVLFSDLITAAGFAALGTSSFPIIRVFGIFVAVGTIGILILSFTFIPALLAVTDERRIRAGVAEHGSPVSGLLTALGRFAVARPRAVGIAGVVLMAGAMLGMTRLRINNNMVDWFQESSAVRRADRLLNERLGGTAPGYIVVAGPDGLFARPDGLRFLEGLEDELARLPRVGKIVSLADAVEQTSAALTGQARKIPDSKEAIAQILLLIGSAKLDNLVDFAHAKANMFVQLRSWDVDAMEQVIATSRRYLADHPLPGARIEPAGIAWFNVVWNQEVLLGMLTSFLSGLFLVLLLLVWEYRSVRVGAIAFLPLLITTALLYGAIGLVGKDFDMPISVLSTLTLGLAIDFAIHFVSRLKGRLAEPDAGTLADALVWTVQRPGLGIIRNAVVFSLGFTVMVFSGFSPYITVGVFMATIMLLSSLVTLVYLPALFRLFPRVLGLDRGSLRSRPPEYRSGA
jgi:predicted RND superfamily exporter protein